MDIEEIRNELISLDSSLFGNQQEKICLYCYEPNTSIYSFHHHYE